MSSLGNSGEKPWVAITGSCSGIGRSSALYLAERGFPVLLTSERPQALRETQSAIRDKGGRAEVLDLDLLEVSEVESFWQRVQERIGFCEVLVNNAGIGLHKTLEESTDAEFRRIFEINFFAVVSLCRQALSYMKKEGRGRIINISSASARRSLARMSCYGATKGAVHCFSQALRLEAAPHGVSVTEILPISVRTDFFERAGYQPKGLVQSPETIARLIERAIRTGEAELCSSQLARLGFLLDVVAPNLSARLLEWHRRFRS